MKVCAVILAGGGGTRFWPLSRQNTPKQILNISGNDILINETIKRISDIIPHEDIFVITNHSQKEAMEELLLDEIPRENILLEPFGRNTAACIAYASMVIGKMYEDAVMLILPSDHYIKDEEEFRRLLSECIDTAATSDKLLTVGIKPVFPATGYGYIRYDSSKSLNHLFEVEKFIEKPEFEKAKEFIKDKCYLWNSGMFIWRVKVILENFKRYLPRLYKSMLPLSEEFDLGKLEEIYESLQSISIDYGILERSDDVMVMPGDFGWSDVGSWDMLGEIFPTDSNGNIVKADHISLDTSNSIIYGTNRLIATIGMKNVIIADTSDALLVCPKDSAQDVKKLVDLIRSSGRNEYI